MLRKTIEKQKRKQRKTWTGYYTRKTPTKEELKRKIEKKHKGKEYPDVV